MPDAAPRSEYQKLLGPTDVCTTDPADLICRASEAGDQTIGAMLVILSVVAALAALVWAARPLSDAGVQPASPQRSPQQVTLRDRSPETPRDHEHGFELLWLLASPFLLGPFAAGVVFGIYLVVQHVLVTLDRSVDSIGSTGATVAACSVALALVSIGLGLVRTRRVRRRAGLERPRKPIARRTIRASRARMRWRLLSGAALAWSALIGASVFSLSSGLWSEWIGFGLVWVVVLGSIGVYAVLLEDAKAATAE